MSTVEVAFSAYGRSLYLDLPTSDLPRKGEGIRFAGDLVRGSDFADEEFTVLKVTRVYNKDSQELTSVYVDLEPEPED